MGVVSGNVFPVAKREPLLIFVDYYSGNEVEYQDMAYASRSCWLEWNKSLAETPESLLPAGFDRQTTLFVPCGFLRWSDGSILSGYDIDCLEELDKAGLRSHQNHIVSVIGTRLLR